MIQLSEKATEVLNQYFQDKGEPSPIRIFLQEGG